jgi:hypothetical protein
LALLTSFLEGGPPAAAVPRGVRELLLLNHESSAEASSIPARRITFCVRDSGWFFCPVRRAAARAHEPSRGATEESHDSQLVEPPRGKNTTLYNALCVVLMYSVLRCAGRRVYCVEFSRAGNEGSGPVARTHRTRDWGRGQTETHNTTITSHRAHSSAPHMTRVRSRVCSLADQSTLSPLDSDSRGSRAPLGSLES